MCFTLNTLSGMSRDCFIVPDFACCDHGLARVDAGLLLLPYSPSKMKLSQEAMAREGAGTLRWLGSGRTRQTSAVCFPLTWEPVSGVPGTELAETSSFSSCCLMQDQWGIKFLLSLF